MPATRKAAPPKTEPAKAKAATKTASRAAAAPTAKRPAPAARQAATTAAEIPKADPPKQTSRQPAIDPDRRRNYVEVAAYYIAERRGFAGGDEAADWLAAEQEIDRLLREKKLSA